MRERIESLIASLQAIRDNTLENYLNELDNFTSGDGNPMAVHRVGILHDLDHHISNLEGELKRMDALALLKHAKEAINA